MHPELGTAAFGPTAVVRELHTFNAMPILRMTAFAYKRPVAEPKGCISERQQPAKGGQILEIKFWIILSTISRKADFHWRSTTGVLGEPEKAILAPSGLPGPAATTHDRSLECQCIARSGRGTDLRQGGWRSPWTGSPQPELTSALQKVRNIQWTKLHFLTVSQLRYD